MKNPFTEEQKRTIVETCIDENKKVEKRKEKRKEYIDSILELIEEHPDSKREILEVTLRQFEDEIISKEILKYMDKEEFKEAKKTLLEDFFNLNIRKTYSPIITNQFKKE